MSNSGSPEQPKFSVLYIWKPNEAARSRNLDAIIVRGLEWQKL